MNKTYPVTFLELLLIVFITLKLTGHLTWSWWWVLAPFWGSVLFISILALVFYWKAR